MNEVSQHIQQLREDFTKGILYEADIDKIPSNQFNKWMKEAVDSKVNEAQAFHLATVSSKGMPSGRIVYLRSYINDAYYFYTNYQSRKAMEIEQNQFVAATFFWPELERQVRIEGSVTFASKEESDAYFSARPRESQLGGWSSPQSSILSNREELEKQVEITKIKFEGKEVPRPEFWGGYIITANYYEFWQGRKSRLHDRISFEKTENDWNIKRLAP
jgi:pyridoxamine 5'-phosphate oxidase